MEKQRSKGQLGERLLTFKVVGEVSDSTMLWGGETITLDGKVVGDLISATFSPTFGCGVGMGYVKHDRLFEKG